MSTDLYRVRVTSIDRAAKTIGFTVFLVYYDWSGVPTDPSFFMRILWDEADTRFGGGGPLGDKVSVDQYLDEAWIDENTHRFVQRVTRTALRNDPPPVDKMPPTFVYESFTDEDVLTQGDYEVVVTNARWIEHLTVGQTWQTTSYATKAKMPAGRSTVLADVKAATKARRQAWKAEREADVPTTLAEAIRRVDLDAIRTLVANGAELNPQHEIYGDFPLGAACDAVMDAAADAHSPAMRMVELLVELGAGVNHRASPGQAPVLFMAAYRGHDLLARWLVAHGASLDGTDHSDRHTMLHCAVNGGLTWLVERCLAAGADPNAQTSQGHLVIHYAFATDAWQPIVEALVRAGADVAQQSSNWGTALHWAAREGRAAALPWLVEHGIAVDTPSLGDDPETPLMVAARGGGNQAPATIRALLDLGADVHARTPVAGVTALHLAAQWSAEAVGALLAAGADRTVKTIGPSQRSSTRMKAGLLPIDMARRFKIYDAVKLLVGTSTKKKVEPRKKPTKPKTKMSRRR